MPLINKFKIYDNILIIGSSGYFGEIYIKELLKVSSLKVVGADIKDSVVFHKNYKHYQVDCRKYKELINIVKKNNIKIIIHFATLLDFAVKKQIDLYQNNIELAKNIRKVANKSKIKKIIFTSSNSIFAGNKEKKIFDNTTPNPIDMYGKSKIDSEIFFHKKNNIFSCITLRVPNILDEKRIGMLSILFELILNNNILWVVNSGKIFHQCIYSQDLVNAINLALLKKDSKVLNLGSEKVDNFHNLFSKLIKTTNSKSRIIGIKKTFVIFMLRFLKLLNLSPFGGYQIRMLTDDFIFDNKTAIKYLNWYPRTSNFQAMSKALFYYKKIKEKKGKFQNASSNSRPVNMKFLKILMFLK